MTDSTDDPRRPRRLTRRRPAIGAALEAELGAAAPVALAPAAAPARDPRRWSRSRMRRGLLAVLTRAARSRRAADGLARRGGPRGSLGFVVPAYLALVPRAGTMAPRWRAAAIVAVIALGRASSSLGLFIHPERPVERSLRLAAISPTATSCLEIGLATAIVPVVLGAMLLRGALPVGSRWIAAALGAGGGCARRPRAALSTATSPTACTSGSSTAASSWSVRCWPRRYCPESPTPRSGDTHAACALPSSLSSSPRAVSKSTESESHRPSDINVVDEARSRRCTSRRPTAPENAHGPDDRSRRRARRTWRCPRARDRFPASS